jgi:hypothetical protein
MMREAKEAFQQCQRRVQKMLRRMGFTQEGLETSGMGTSMVNPWQPNASDARRNEDFLFRSSTTSGAEGPCGRLGPRMENPR